MTVIVFEGPDGAGKTSALQFIRDEFHLPVLDRATSSVEGPIDDLSGWVEKFFVNWDNQHHTLLDRHPLVSELVYGPIVHKRLSDRFAEAHWLRSHMMEFKQKCVIVWCLPPLDVVQDNVLRTRADQMSGVADNITSIYWTYHAMRATVSGTRQVTYDYTLSDAKDYLKRYVDWIIHHN